MTTGEPLVVRGAMKPLPTLTKPLRSVDIDTNEPAAALRERTDSCTVPAAGVVGEAMVALMLARPTARSSAATTSTTCSAALDPTRKDRVEALGRASGEAAAAPGPRERGALVLVGFMGAGKSTTARTVAAELGVESIDSDHELERELGEPIESFFDRHGEAGVPRSGGGGRAAAALR